MPTVSKRGDEMTQSPIRSLIPYARKAKAEGVHVYHLNIGQPDIETPSAAIDALRHYEDLVIEYGASEGLLSLRETVADYYCENVSPIKLDNIYVTTGASEAILFTLFACFDRGAEIIIPEPFYANYIGFSHTSGVVMKPVTSALSEGFALPQAEAFIEQINDQTKAIFLCNPGNPTGNLYSPAELQEIARIVKEYDLFLIVDEVYREFCYDDTFSSVLELQDLEEHVVVIDSISKVFSACGSRVGFLVTRNQHLMNNVLKYAQLRLCPPMIGQYVAKACFENRNEYLSQVKSEYNSRRLFLYNRLKGIKGIQCYLPKAAFYFMAELPVDNASDFCKWLLSDFRYQGATVMMAPGDGFYLNAENGKQQVRIAFVLDIESLKKAMDILEAALDAYPGRKLPQTSTNTLTAEVS